MFPASTHALLVATSAHDGQRRKYTGEPYVVHPIRVASLLRTAYSIYGYDAVVIDRVAAAATMHDVLEDTTYALAEMTRRFGGDITALVREVTDVSQPSDGNRAERKRIDREHLTRASAHGQSIKVADLLDNTHCITKHDPDFAKVYLAEKRLLLPLLTKANPLLVRWAQDQLDGVPQTIFDTYPQVIK